MTPRPDTPDEWPPPGHSLTTPRPGVGHHAEIPLPAPSRIPPPPRPATGAPRWFGHLVMAGAVVALVVAGLAQRAINAERDARVSDLATEACTP